MQLFSKHKNAEIHVFPRFRRFFISLIICAKTNSPPHAVALKAFEQNAFFILADNRQLETLDDMVYLHDGLVVNFIKLTPLVGG